MKKYTKSYVDVFCNTGAIRSGEVEERDPSIIQNDGYIHGFRFFDISFIEDDGLIYKSTKHNYSKNIYFGRRCTFDELTKIFPLLEDIKKNGSYCLFSDGVFLELDDDDMIYDELMEQKTKQK